MIKQKLKQMLIIFIIITVCICSLSATSYATGLNAFSDVDTNAIASSETNEILGNTFEDVDEDAVASSDANEVLGNTLADASEAAEDLSYEYSSSSSSSGSSWLGKVLDGVVGIIFWVAKLFIMIPARVVMSLVSIAICGTDSMVGGFTLDRILFNGVPLLSVNFFEIPDDSNTANYNTIVTIRENVSTWYVSIRNLAAVILAIMVIYVGIRMAMSTVAEEQAKYKKMLVDWVVSLVLLFVLHYIMLFIVEINDALVDILNSVRTSTTSSSLFGVNLEIFSTNDIMTTIWNKAMNSISAITQIAYTFTYFALAAMTFIFFITYLKRMITIAFLIMISPIITVTYSLDRMGDGKSQALNKWFKEYTYNILIQPFHCIIYLALVESAINSLSGNVSLGTALLAILMVVFMYQAEDIIKELFHFNEANSVAKTVAQTAIVTSAIGAVKNIGGSKRRSSGGSSGNRQRNNQNNQNNQTNQTGGTGGSNSGNSGQGQNSTSTQTGGGQATSTQSQGQAGGLGGGSGSSSSTTGGSNNQSPTNTNTREESWAWRNAKRAGKGVLGAAWKAEKLAIKGAAGIAMMGLGAGTGSLTTAMTGFTTGWGAAGSAMQKRQDSAQQRKMAKTYGDQIERGNLYQGKDENWIRQHTKDMLSGDIDAQDFERDYYNQMMQAKDYYMDQGLSEDAAISQVDQTLAGIQSGRIGETTFAQRRYTNAKNLKNKINNYRNRNHNYGGQNNGGTGNNN